MGPRRIWIIASASGNGKTTVGRELAGLLDVPFVELDALVHGPGWTENPDEEVLATLEPILAGEGWVVDGTYTHKFGQLILDAPDLIVWLDLPVHVWLPRVIARTWRRIRNRELLWGQNRETVSGVLLGWDTLIPHALRSHVRRRRHWPAMLAGRNFVRLRTRAEVDAFLISAGRSRVV